MSHCITLNGYMGAGKSFLGKKLAERLKIQFYDLDDIIEHEVGLTIAEIFDKYGEFYFRKLERKVLKNALKENRIIATGGGTPCFYDNIKIIKNKSLSIYLSVGESDLISRLQGESDHRPLIAGLSDAELYKFVLNQINKRSKFYNLCEYRINNTDKDEALSSIVNIVNDAR